MAQTLPNNLNFPTSNQVPNNAIMDMNGRQAYLGNHFVYCVAGLALNDTATHNVVLIQNPAANTKSLFLDLRRVSSSAQAVQVKVCSNPTFSAAGTPVTPVNMRLASANTSTATVTTGPTTSATGTLVHTIEAPTDYYVTTDSNFLIILDPGQNILITAAALASTTLLNLNLSWYEI